MRRSILAVLLALPGAQSPGLALAASADAAFAARVNGALKAFAPSPGSRPVLRSKSEADDLLALLADPDPAKRIEALRSLRKHAHGALAVRQKVLERYVDEGEALEVRVQAAKTLSLLGDDAGIRKALLAYAQGGAEPWLRTASYQALYAGAAMDPDALEALLSAAAGEPDKQVRLGAIWGLFASSKDQRIWDLLLQLAINGTDVEVRVEAFKSLYNAMGESRVAQFVIQVSLHKGMDPALRKPAILLLSNVKDPSIRGTLEQLAWHEPDWDLRRAASLALRPQDPKLAAYFHLPKSLPGGETLDPMDGDQPGLSPFSM